MEIRHEETARGGRFVTGDETAEAELTYSPAGSARALVFDHTYVPPALRGRGIAEALVEHGAAYAREKGMTVVPACSYVRALFERHPERYGDLAAQGGSQARSI